MSPFQFSSTRSSLISALIFTRTTSWDSHSNCGVIFTCAIKFPVWFSTVWVPWPQERCFLRAVLKLSGSQTLNWACRSKSEHVISCASPAIRILVLITSEIAAKHSIYLDSQASAFVCLSSQWATGDSLIFITQLNVFPIVRELSSWLQNKDLMKSHTWWISTSHLYQCTSCSHCPSQFCISLGVWSGDKNLSLISRSTWEEFTKM